MTTLHRRGVRGYVTFNTLVFEHELDAAAKTIASIAEAGADAIIVQDYGVVKLARRIVPDLELHASTQMSITNAQGVKLAQSFGIRRVTLARELSLDEVSQIVRDTGCEIEIFVHGALCVAYSGQCFSSEAWGGRSANRGQCAQACRLPYELLVDGQLEPLGDARYLLSPGDLYALRDIPKVIDSGAAALKIEGRYKDADYVALATAAYRKAVDEAWAGRKLSVTRDEELALEQVYSRGLGAHFINGTNHQTVVQGRAPRHRGVLMGTVTGVSVDWALIQPAEAHKVRPLKAGDGLVFDAADWRSPQEDEEGGRVYAVTPRLDGFVELRFGNGAIDFSRVREGDLVWRTHDPDLDRVVKPFLEPAAPVTKQPVAVHVEAAAGAPLRTEWRLTKRPEVTVRVESPSPLDAAKARGLSLETLRDQFDRLGNTAYELGELTAQIEGAVFVPVSLLNQMRREAVERLQERQGAPKHVEVHAASIPAPTPGPAASATRLHVLVRTPEQLDAAIAERPSSITLDYLDLYGLRPSVERVKASGVAVRVASPRVLKPGEARIVNFLASLECPVLVRSAGMVEALAGVPLIGDFSLNTANAITAETYFAMGVSVLTPTHDLNAAQVADLARKVGGERIEVVAYQHLPVFHTEHCVFCRFLSKGNHVSRLRPSVRGASRRASGRARAARTR